MFETTEELARQRQNFEKSAEQGVCQIEATWKNHEHHAKGHKHHSTKKYPSGMELVRVLSAAVHVAYLKGEFHQENEYDSASSAHVVKSLDDMISSTHDGRSSTTPLSLCEMQSQA